MAMMELCDRILMPVREDPIASGKIQQFEKSLQLLEMNRLSEKITKLSFPFSPEKKLPDLHPEQLLWGEAGDSVRKLLKLWEQPDQPAAGPA